MTALPTTDADRLDLVASRLYTAVISDVIDSLGFRDQAMDARLRPVWHGATVVGRAHTLLTVDIFELRPDPYRKEIEAVDTLKPGDVLVGATGPSTRTCLWGELLSTASVARGARGAIVDGYVRDVRQIAEMRFPVFATGMKPVDSAGRSEVVEYGTPVACGGVLVHEGDLVVADTDGIIVVPRAVEDDAVRLALEKVDGENRMRDAIRGGMTLAEAFAKHGIL
jgi:4-hydroxy-4-methyl-2-oxoglutarate aldolase